MIVPSESCVDTVRITRVANPAFVLKATPATCNGGAKNADGKITILGFAPDARYDLVEAGVYAGTATFSSAKEIPLDGIVLKDLASPTSPVTYSIRVFNGNNCFKDQSITLQPTFCNCPPPVCVPFNFTRKRAAR